MPPELPTIPRKDWTPPSRTRVAGIRRALQGIYGIPAPPPHRRPVDELVLTLLSQSTSDRNRDVAFLRLRERFATWEAVRDAPQPAVEAAIQPGGLHRTKSVRLQALLRELGDDLDLGHLEHAPVEQARAELCGLPGVGRKTTACVLLFAYHRRDVPVDTHVGRVATRLGLLRPGAPSEEQHDAFLALTPRGAELELHVNLLRHGRRTCSAQRPVCPECVLRSRCPSRRV